MAGAGSAATPLATRGCRLSRRHRRCPAATRSAPPADIAAGGTAAAERRSTDRPRPPADIPAPAPFLSPPVQPARADASGDAVRQVLATTDLRKTRIRLPSKQRGGAAKALNALAQELAKAGYRASCCTEDDP